MQSNHGNPNTNLRNRTVTERAEIKQSHGCIHFLPSRGDADCMIHLYFTTVNLMIPCIHEDSFRQMYQDMWRHGPKRMSKPWLGSLNLIFALAKNIITPTSPSHERVSASNKFYQRAMDLIKPYILGPLSVDLSTSFVLFSKFFSWPLSVQAYLLAVIYL